MIRPFSWDRIARYDAAQAAATNQCARLLGARGVEVAHDLQQLFCQLGFEALELKLAHVAAHRGAVFQPELGAGYATNFLVPGLGASGAVAIDHSLVETALSALAGVPATSPRLGDWDFGIVSWLLLRVAKVLAHRGAPPVSLVVERKPVERIAEDVAGPWTVHEIVVDVRLDDHRGWARLFLPDPTLTHLLQAADFSDQTVPEGARARVPCALRLVAGHTFVSPRELDALGRGDVLLLDEHALEVGQLRKTTFGRVAAGDCFLEADVSSDAGIWRFHITDLTPHRGKEMSETSGTTTQLGQDAMIAVETVVGRTTLTFAELSRLKPGQILVADRSVGEPVDIVANGTVVAQGELVDVEGRLGVRVLTLAR